MKKVLKIFCATGILFFAHSLSGMDDIKDKVVDLLKKVPTCMIKSAVSGGLSGLTGFTVGRLSKSSKIPKEAIEFHRNKGLSEGVKKTTEDFTNKLGKILPALIVKNTLIDDWHTKLMPKDELEKYILFSEVEKHKQDGYNEGTQKTKNFYDTKLKKILKKYYKEDRWDKDLEIIFRTYKKIHPVLLKLFKVKKNGMLPYNWVSCLMLKDNLRFYAEGARKLGAFRNNNQVDMSNYVRKSQLQAMTYKWRTSNNTIRKFITENRQLKKELREADEVKKKFDLNVEKPLRVLLGIENGKLPKTLNKYLISQEQHLKKLKEKSQKHHLKVACLQDEFKRRFDNYKESIVKKQPKNEEESDD